MKNLNFFKYSIEVFRLLRLWDRQIGQDKSPLSNFFLYTMIAINGSIIPIMGFSDIFKSVKVVEVPVLLCKIIFASAYLVCIIKLISVTIFKKEIYELIKQVEQLSFKFQVQNDINRSLEIYNKMVYTASVAMNFLSALNLVISIVINELPFRSKVLILDFGESPYYEIMFLYQTIALVAVANLTIAHDTLFCGLLSLCGSILSSISREVSDIDDRSESGENPETILKNVIEKIIETFSIIQKISDVFSIATLANVLFISNQMALCVYLVSVWGLKDLTGLLMTMIAIVQTFDLWIFCYFSQFVANQNEKLQRQLYYTNWYDYTKNFKTMLRLTILITQNDRFVKAGRIIELSLATFSDFIQKAYALYTFLVEVR